MFKARLSEVAARLSARPAEARKGPAPPDASPADMQGRLTGRLRALLDRPVRTRESRRAAGASSAVQCIAPQQSAPVPSAVGPAVEERYSELSVLDPDFRGVLYVARSNDPSDEFVAMIRVTDGGSVDGMPRIAVGPSVDSWRGRGPMTPFGRQLMQDGLWAQMYGGHSVMLNESFSNFRFLQRNARQSSE